MVIFCIKGNLLLFSMILFMVLEKLKVIFMVEELLVGLGLMVVFIKKGGVIFMVILFIFINA